MEAPRKLKSHMIISTTLANNLDQDYAFRNMQHLRAYVLVDIKLIIFLKNGVLKDKELFLYS